MCVFCWGDVIDGKCQSCGWEYKTVTKKEKDSTHRYDNQRGTGVTSNLDSEGHPLGGGCGT